MINAEEFARMRQNIADRNDLLQSLRPQPESLGEVLSLIGDQSRTLLAMRPTSVSHHPWAATPVPDQASGSLSAQDKRTFESSSLNRANTLVAGAVADCLYGASDHARGMGFLLSDERNFRTAIATSRLILDASARLMFILEPGISADSRLSRVGNLRLKALDEEIADLDRETESEKIEELDSIRTSMLSAGLADGLQTTKSPRRAFFEPNLSTGHIMNVVMNDDIGKHFWRQLSSVIHVQERPLVQLQLGLGGHERQAPIVSKVLCELTFFSVYAFAKAMPLAHSYFERSLERLTPGTDDLINNWYRAGGFVDEIYEDELVAAGHPPIDWSSFFSDEESP